MFEYVRDGWCPVCEARKRFTAVHGKPLEQRMWPYWMRDALVCETCGSLSRERALMRAIQMLMPDWRRADVHESSSVGRGASLRLKHEAKSYIESHFVPGLKLGSLHPQHNVRIEDLERQTFADASFDLTVSQDVFEHVFRPDRLLRESLRTLRQGGWVIMTFPLATRSGKTEKRAKLIGGQIKYLKEPIYHGNPVDDKGSLVTYDYGMDIVDMAREWVGEAPVWAMVINDLSQGISDWHNLVLAVQKA